MRQRNTGGKYEALRLAEILQNHTAAKKQNSIAIIKVLTQIKGLKLSLEDLQVSQIGHTIQSVRKKLQNKEAEQLCVSCLVRWKAMVTSLYQAPPAKGSPKPVVKSTQNHRDHPRNTRNLSTRLTQTEAVAVNTRDTTANSRDRARTVKSSSIQSSGGNGNERVNTSRLSGTSATHRPDCLDSLDSPGSPGSSGHDEDDDEDNLTLYQRRWNQIYRYHNLEIPPNNPNKNRNDLKPLNTDLIELSSSS